MDTTPGLVVEDARHSEPEMLLVLEKDGGQELQFVEGEQVVLVQSDPFALGELRLAAGAAAGRFAVGLLFLLAIVAAFFLVLVGAIFDGFLVLGGTAFVVLVVGRLLNVSGGSRIIVFDIFEAGFQCALRTTERFGDLAPGLAFGFHLLQLRVELGRELSGVWLVVAATATSVISCHLFAVVVVVSAGWLVVFLLVVLGTAVTFAALAAGAFLVIHQDQAAAAVAHDLTVRHGRRLFHVAVW